MRASRRAFHVELAAWKNEIAMVRRYLAPARADLFNEGHRPTWLVAEDPWRRKLEMRALPPGTDLIRTFLLELLKYHDSGWRLSEFSAGGGYFFAQKSMEVKRRVYITTDDPAEPEPKGYGSTSDSMKKK